MAAAPLALALLAALLNPWEYRPRSLEDCDARVARYPREFEAWFCYQQVSFFQPKKEWEKKTADHLRARLEKNPDEALARLMIALVEYGDDSPALLTRAAKDLQRDGNDSGEVAARTDLATEECEEGRFAEGWRELERAQAAAAHSGQPELVAQAEVFAGNCARAQADYGRAFELYRSAWQRLTSSAISWRTDWLLGNAFDGLGQLYASTGRHQEALEIFRAQLEKRASDPFMHACAEHRVAQEAVRLAQQGGMGWDEADALIEQALADEVKYGCRVYINGGEIFTRMLHAERLGATDAGVAEAKLALEQARQYADEFRLGRPLRLYATLLAERAAEDADSRKAALGAVEEAIALAKKLGTRSELARGLLTRAQLEARFGDAAAALADDDAALDQLDRLRELQPEQMVRARTAAEWSSAYRAVAGQLAASGKLERALQTMERMRARSLLELLEASAAPPGAEAQALREERTALLARLSRLQRQLLRGASSEEGPPPLGDAGRAAVLEQVKQLETAEEDLRDRLARLSPRPPALRAPALGELRARLRPGEALLLFQLFDREGEQSAGLRGSSWLVAITGESARAFPIPDAEALGGQIELLSGLIERRDGSEAAGARRLGDQLLGEALAALGPRVTRLSIVPDGVLHKLPFEALRDARGPLAKHLEVSLAPSAALWLRWRTSAQRSAPIPALAFGDPALAFDDPAASLGDRTLAAATSAQAAAGGNARRDEALFRSPGPLPGARDEALEVAKLLGRGSEAWVGEEASEARLKSAELSRYGVLHLAAHAVIDELRPERSAILLAPGSAGEDGLLQLREIEALHLEGGAVVLATCSSSSGELLQGEGVVSLARGFFQAGARAVVGSLWPLRDDEARLFFAELYRHLGEGQPLAEAMAAARRARLDAGAPAAAWAGLILLGDGESRPVSPAIPELPWRWMAVSLCAGTLASALLWLSWRRRAPAPAAPPGRPAPPPTLRDR